MPPPKEPKEPEGKDIPKWKKELEKQKLEKQKLEKQKLEKKQTQDERAVNPMTMIPDDVSISGKMPLPPKAKPLKRLFGF